jgi:hypothetical protein
MQLPKPMVTVTPSGASGDVDGIFVPDPMCSDSTLPVASHAAKNGSQSPLWMLGNPRYAGISEKHTARTPRAALRSTSAAASAGSHNGTRHSGTSRPSLPAHHSSIIQSLYARTQSSASSRSLASRNVWPQNRGKFGKHKDACVQFASMSFTRAAGSKHPGRTSSYVVAVMVMSSRSRPEAATARFNDW